MSQITMSSSGVVPCADRRERRKRRTREALLGAALELFLSKGYEQTAVHEIADAADVSQRTFFRYFACKEDLVLSFIQDAASAFAEELATRPAGEDPFSAIRNAYISALRRAAHDTEEFSAYLSALMLIESTPGLLAGHMRYVHEHTEETVRVLARREGVDPEADPRPRVLAGVTATVMMLAIRDWRGSHCQSLDAMIATFSAYADAVLPALTGHWS